MSSPQLLIKSVPYQDVLTLRAKVLKPFLTPAECVNPGDLRADTFHLAAFLEGQIIGIASFEVENYPALPSRHAFRLRGMGADPERRRLGIGRSLVLGGEKEILTRGGDLLWFNARLVAFPFYESLGYAYFGEMFTLPRIGEHKVMYKYLQKP